MLIANSLRGAVLRLLGHKIDRQKVPFLRPIDDSRAARGRPSLARWGRFVTAHARAVFAVVLLVLALAATSLLVPAWAPPTRARSRRSRRPAAPIPAGRGFGPGSTARSRSSWTSTTTPRRADLPGRAGARDPREPQFNDEDGGDRLRDGLRSAGRTTDKLVDRLREDVVPAATQGGDAVAYVAGLTAAFIDADRIMERLPFFLLYIIGVTFIVLAMAFRSIVISLTAAITTILSAFVAFGVLTLVVQEGYLLGLHGLDRTGPIETFVRRLPSRSSSGSRWTTWSSS